MRHIDPGWKVAKNRLGLPGVFHRHERGEVPFKSNEGVCEQCGESVPPHIATAYKLLVMSLTKEEEARWKTLQPWPYLSQSGQSE
jgi:hypothetical protein